MWQLGRWVLLVCVASELARALAGGTAARSLTRCSFPIPPIPAGAPCRTSSARSNSTHLKKSDTSPSPVHGYLGALASHCLAWNSMYDMSRLRKGHADPKG